MFSQSVIESIGYYVYFLVDPRTNQTFYVGKGTGNRVFAHANAAEKAEEDDSNKIAKINEILAEGKAVKYYILRHGLSESEAFMLESALIDYIGTDRLTNEVSGHNSSLMTTDEIVTLYEAKEVEITDPVLLININNLYRRDMTQEEIYNATRVWWKVNLSRCNKAKYVLSVYKGIVRQVYCPQRWYSGFTEKGQARVGFEGVPAEQGIRDKYVNCSVSKYFSKGSQNPVKYVNCNPGQ